MPSVEICTSGAKIPVVPALQIDNYWLVDVGSTSSVTNPSKDHIYRTPDGNYWVVGINGTFPTPFSAGGGGATDLTGVVKNPTWNGATYVLTLPIQGSPPLVIDLPVESLIKGMSFESSTNELVLTLDSGAEQRVPLNALVVGLASETWVTSQITNAIDELAVITDLDTLQIIEDFVAGNDINANDDAF